MEIIKNGKEKTFYAKCGNCATELHYKLEDVNSEESLVLKTETKYIFCPECNAPIIVHLLTEEEAKEQAKQMPSYAFGRCVC